MKKYQILLLIALMFITVFAFYPVLKAGFVNLDDMIFIEGNWKINSFSIENIKALLLDSHFRLYHPIVNISFAVERYFFDLDPYYYHVTNLILHLFNTLLIFWALYLITRKNFFVSFIAAFIFACHPMHVESVAWISSRKDTLYAFFFLLSLIAYLKSKEPTSKTMQLYILSLLLFVCACLSKSMAVTMPAVLILTDWFQGDKFSRKSILKYLPFFIVTAFFSILTYAGYYDIDDKVRQTSYTFFINVFSAHFNILFYMVKFIFPVNLAVIYPAFFNANAIPPEFIMKAPALLYGLTVLVIASLKYTKKIFFGFALFIIMISPVINVFPAGIAPVADRYTYVPFIGFAYLAAVLIVFLYGKIKAQYIKNAFVVLIAAVFGVMCIACNVQARVWENTKTLFDSQIEKYPGEVAQAYSTRGIYFEEINMPKEKEKDLIEALRINPRHSLAIFSLAGIKMSQEKYLEAFELYSRITRADPNITLSYINMAKIYYEFGKQDKAFEMLTRAITDDIHPTYVYAFYNAGEFYEKTGNKDKALENYILAAKYFPKSCDAYIKIANIYFERNDIPSTLETYIEAIQKTNADLNILFSLAVLYFVIGENDRSERVFLDIIKKEPGHAKSYDYLGSIYAMKKDYKKALQNFTMAILIDNSLGIAYFHRAVVHFENKKYELAKENVMQAEKSGFDVPDDFKESMVTEAGIIL